MTGLFSALQLEDETVERPVGFRLQRLEVLNWGTFDRRVWRFEPAGNTALLTGDIGSGKSTLVDAVTTLLLPAQRIAYNKAAGALTRERDLRSYVLGHYKSERSEDTGTSRAVGLRTDGTTHSVLLAHYRNEALDADVTLAQVFWLRPGQHGQPERFYVVADLLAIDPHFVGFGSDVAALRKRLRAGGAAVFDRFPDYGTEYRRRLGVESPQAMDLFLQTVSMKSVTDLTDFVRSHMLEPFDAAEQIDNLVQHFQDLTRAHDAVVSARAQLAALAPVVAQCDSLDQLMRAVVELSAQREALPGFAAARVQAVLADVVRRAEQDLTAVDAERQRVTGELADVRSRITALEIERAGYGGDRLSTLEQQLRTDAEERDRRRRRRVSAESDAVAVGLGQLPDKAAFAALQARLDDATSAVERAKVEAEEQLKDLWGTERELEADIRDVREEMASLRRQRGNVPRQFLALRGRISEETGVPVRDLPFAGELLQVREEAGAWEGAAERVLRGLGLSLLVPEARYAAVSDWIDRNHLGMRLVYHRVPATVPARAPDARPDGGSALRLRDVLQIRDDSPMYAWLDRELDRVADHLCAPSMAEFRRAQRAVTTAGQVRTGGRHVKDDEHRLDDRSRYVLGWSNERKVEALLTRAQQLDAARQRLRERLDAARTAVDDAAGRQAALRRLAEIETFAELDWQSVVHRIEAARAEKERIERSSGDLERVTQLLAEAAADVERLDEQSRSLSQRAGGLSSRIAAAQERQARAVAVVEAGPPVPQGVDEPLAGLAASAALASADDVDRWERETRELLTRSIDGRTTRAAGIGHRIVALMGEFRREFPAVSAEMDAAVEAAGEYRRLHERLLRDDLPRFENDFRTYLRTNTIREIASFQSRLAREVDLIRTRIDHINESLHEIDYNPGRFIRLEPQLSSNVEIRDFRADLRACTDAAITGGEDEQYSEARFLQVKRIVERFQGRTGQTEADKAWTTRVTDVRNWFVFAASERWRQDGTEYETYSDSGGKSGGQKEKLAYTVLAASLAYQFRLEWGVTASRTFRFVVIDEAFGRGSDESTRFALRLFRKLGLQLLIVTPLQKIRVIEPFVAAVGFVDNRSGGSSRLQTLTIEEFHARREAYVGARALELPDGVVVELDR